MSFFGKPFRIVLVGLSALLATVAQAQAPKLDSVVEHVEALDATRWIGWSSGTPSTVYLLQAGSAPQSVGQLPKAPSAIAVGRDRVLWVGQGYTAVAPLKNLSAIKTTPSSEWFTLAVGNTLGFAIAGGRQLAFSADGESWQPVTGYQISEHSSIRGLAKDETHFVALIDMGAGQPDSDYIYSLLALSGDGLNWKNTYVSEPTPGEPELTTIANGNGRWMAFGIGSAYTSTDGQEWEEKSAGGNAMPSLRNAVIQTGGGEWWAEDWKDRFAFSPDGLDWSAELQYLHHNKGAGPFWVVGPEGMRNLGLDEQGKVRINTLAALQAGTTPWPDAMVVAKPAAPAKPATLSNEELAKQWAKLDEELHAQDTFVEFCRKLADLSVLFSRAQDTELGKAVQSSALVFVLQRGDAACLAAFKPALNDKEYKDALFILEKGLETKRALLKGKQLPAVSRGERGTEIVGNQWDVNRMRLNLLDGKRGSAFDLSLVYLNGNSVKSDKAISFLWNLVTQTLIPGLDDYESAEGVEKLLAAGSGVVAGNSSGNITLAKGEAGISERQWRLVAQAADAGLILAKKFQDARDTWRVGAAYMPEPVWPPAKAKEWTAEITQKNRALFDRHVAFSRDVMAYRAELTPGADPDRAKWQKLLDRHQALLNDPDIEALYEAYVQNSMSMALLYTADTPISPSWMIHMEEAKKGLAAVAINPDLWAFRARMLQWSGQLDEARRDATIAVLLLDLKSSKASQFAELIDITTIRLRLELNLPASVLDAPQKSIAPYNLGVTKRNGFLGKLVDSDNENIIALYGNFGARLKAVWALPDLELRARAERDLFAINGADLKNFNYPEAQLKPFLTRADEIWSYRNKEPQRALQEMEKLVTEVAHPFFLVQRAKLLGIDGQRDAEVNALQNVLSTWPSYKVAKSRLAELQKSIQAEEESVALAQYKQALNLLNYGNLTDGRAELERVTDGEKPPLMALLVLAELQANPQEVAQAESTLRRAMALYPYSSKASAQLAMLLITQRKIDEALQVLDRALKEDAEAPETRAVKVLAETFTALASAQTAGPTLIQDAITRLESLKSLRFAPEVHAILAQFKMMMRDQAGAVDELALTTNGKEYVPPEMWFQLGQLMRNLGNTEAAKTYIEKAAERGVPQAKELLKQL